MDTTGTPSAPGFGSRMLRALRNLMILAVVLGCAGAAGWALSVLNAKSYGLEIREGKLFVLKGKMLPMGADVWQPTDVRLAEAYAPLELGGNNPIGVTQAKYGDRDELDRALFSVIELLAAPRVASDNPKDLEQGLYYVRRAERLNGLGDEQKLSLKRMRSEVSFYIARTRMEDAQKQVEEALVQLRLAAGSESRHQRAASQMLLAVEPQAQALATALTQAVHTLSLPPGTAPTPAPAVEAPPAVAPSVAPAPDVPVTGGGDSEPSDTKTVERK